MKIQRFEVPGLSHYSYLVSANGKAVVIDPKRDVDTYIDYAEAQDLKITQILETHIHADYASGALELSKATGAELWLSAYDKDEDFEYAFDHHEFKDGEALEIGEMRFVALHTPGHTPEHLSFVLYDSKKPNYPVALFSGDFVFVGSLGRPDLLGEAAKEKLAGELYRSITERIKSLPDGIEVHPAHGAGSLCGAGMGDRPQTTLGYERALNAYFGISSKEEFVRQILASSPEFPDYYRRMKKINPQGSAVLGEIPGDRAIDVQEFRRLADDGNHIVLDVRRPEAFGGAHIRGSLNIGADQNLSTWAAWVLPYDTPILVVGDDSTNYDHVRRSLIRVGLDGMVGHLKGGFKVWTTAALPVENVPQISVDELEMRLSQPGIALLDVRSPNEWRNGHVAEARHIPAGEIHKRIEEIPRTDSVHVICGSGYRSSIVNSILRQRGFQDTVNVIGGMTAWMEKGYPVVKGEGAGKAAG